jgi:DNA invertase Pin-like site-specific DNA recombinase
MSDKVTPGHLRRLAYVYIRQSTLTQMERNRESTARQYGLVDRAKQLGWTTDVVRAPHDARVSSS